jgi:hypothetical protein
VGEAPEETTPQVKAHIGANHVIGFRSSMRALGAGVAIPTTLEFYIPECQV